MIRVIDSKGRLFGAINIIDLIVVMVLVFSAFLAFKWSKVAEDPSWVKVEIFHTRCVAMMQLTPYVADIVKEGDEAVDSDGLVVARIEKLLSNKPSSTLVYTSRDGEKMVFNSESREVRVILDLLSYKKRGEVFASMTGLPIRTGSGLMISTNKYFVQINILEIIGSKEYR